MDSFFFCRRASSARFEKGLFDDKWEMLFWWHCSWMFRFFEASVARTGIYVYRVTTGMDVAQPAQIAHTLC